MYEHILNLTACGPRHPGSRGDIHSRDYLTAIGQAQGLETWTMPAEVTLSEPGPATLHVTNPARVIDCLPQDRSAPTPAGGVSGRLVYTGLGREEDYAGLDAGGALVLQEIWGLHMTTKVDISHRRGAAGCVWIHGHPGGARPAWGLGREASPVPVVCVSHEDGLWLRHLVETGQHILARLRSEVRNCPGSSDHILMRWRTRAAAAQPAVLLVAHRDTTHISPGANDNGSGVAVVLEVLRAADASDLPFDLVGVLTTAEEGGGIGVAQIARYLGADGGLGGFGGRAGSGAAYAINLDMLAVGGPLRLVTGSAAQATSGHLNSALRQAAAQLGYSLSDYLCPMGLADAGPLIAAGIESTWLFKPDDPRFHTCEDKLEHVNPNDLKAAAEIVVRALELLPRAGR
jgi:aminopeptidase YwaD